MACRSFRRAIKTLGKSKVAMAEILALAEFLPNAEFLQNLALAEKTAGKSGGKRYEMERFDSIVRFARLFTRDMPMSWDARRKVQGVYVPAGNVLVLDGKETTSKYGRVFIADNPRESANGVVHVDRIRMETYVRDWRMDQCWICPQDMTREISAWAESMLPYRAERVHVDGNLPPLVGDCEVAVPCKTIGDWIIVDSKKLWEKFRLSPWHWQAEEIDDTDELVYSN